MTQLDTRNWFRTAFKLQGSVIRPVLPRTLICTLFGVLITVLYLNGWPVALPVLVAFVPNIVLGLLLVFRTNTAYDRFWEGRKWWGSLINDVRNLARYIWVSIEEPELEARLKKESALKMLVAFAISMKLHLRFQRPNREVQILVSTAQFDKLCLMNNPPLEVALWISDYLQQQHQAGLLSMYQLTAMLGRLDNMVNALGACERILKTPIPLAYTIHLKQLLLLYALSLPFQLVKDLVWLTGPVVGLFSFILLGIEEIGIEIENPFGTDPNDLPLDLICQTMLRNIEDLISPSPSMYQPTQLKQSLDLDPG